MNKEYNACIYTRLSRDDGDKLESDSIINQRALIRDFLKKHPEIHVVSEKTDDGYSGVNFDRPAFQELMNEIRSGKVNCVVVKDLSRFGRNYIEAGNYIEKVFPFMGVRFIAINDSYDSMDKNQADSLIIPFKNLINDAYCKDISVKIRSQLEIKRKNGEYIGAFVVYGYLKDPEDKNRIIADPFASEVVRAIYKWKIEGMSQGRIAERLNAQGVLCPIEYKKSIGVNLKSSFQVHKKAQWSAVAVERILKNEIYTGVLIQGKRSTPNHKVKKTIVKDESEWIRIEDSHEAIVDRETFLNVQSILKRDIRIAPEEELVYTLSGYVKCGDCGQNMVRKSFDRGKKHYCYYVCSTHKRGKGCSTHSISADALMKSVLNTTRRYISTILEMAELIETVDKLPEQQRGILNYDAQIVRLKEDIEKNESFKLKLYENLQEGIINQEEYFMFKKSYSAKIQKSAEAIKLLEEERDRMLDGTRERMSWINVFKKNANLKSLDRTAVVELIESILVYEDRRVEVVFRYRDESEKYMALLENMQAEQREQAV